MRWTNLLLHLKQIMEIHGILAYLIVDFLTRSTNKHLDSMHLILRHKGERSTQWFAIAFISSTMINAVELEDSSSHHRIPVSIVSNHLLHFRLMQCRSSSALLTDFHALHHELISCTLFSIASKILIEFNLSHHLAWKIQQGATRGAFLCASLLSSHMTYATPIDEIESLLINSSNSNS